MDCARIYETKDRQKSLSYLDRARTLIISTQNNQKLVDFFLYELKLTLSLKQFEKCHQLLKQCEEKIYLGKFKLESVKNLAVLRVKFELGMAHGNALYLAEQAVEQLWRSDRI